MQAKKRTIRLSICGNVRCISHVFLERTVQVTMHARRQTPGVLVALSARCYHRGWSVRIPTCIVAQPSRSGFSVRIFFFDGGYSEDLLVFGETRRYFEPVFIRTGTRRDQNRPTNHAMHACVRNSSPAITMLPVVPL